MPKKRAIAINSNILERLETLEEKVAHYEEWLFGHNEMLAEHHFALEGRAEEEIDEMEFGEVMASSMEARGKAAFREAPGPRLVKE